MSILKTCQFVRREKCDSIRDYFSHKDANHGQIILYIFLFIIAIILRHWNIIVLRQKLLAYQQSERNIVSNKSMTKENYGKSKNLLYQDDKYLKVSFNIMKQLSL